MKRLTLGAAVSQVKSVGLRLRHDRDWQEYVVFVERPTEVGSYHTDDLQDAVDTARFMARERSRSRQAAFAEAVL